MPSAARNGQQKYEQIEAGRGHSAAFHFNSQEANILIRQREFLSGIPDNFHKHVLEELTFRPFDEWWN